MTAQEAIDLIRSGRLQVQVVPEPEDAGLRDTAPPDLLFQSPDTGEVLDEGAFYELLLGAADANLKAAQIEAAEMAAQLNDPVPAVTFGDELGWLNAYSSQDEQRRFPKVSFSIPFLAATTPGERRALCAHEMLHLHHGDGILNDAYEEWTDGVVDRLLEIPLIRNADHAYKRRKETRADIGSLVLLQIPVGDMINVLTLLRPYVDPNPLEPNYPTFRARLRSLAAAYLRPVDPETLQPARTLKRIEGADLTR